jgi:hypothetical protein
VLPDAWEHCLYEQGDLWHALALSGHCCHAQFYKLSQSASSLWSVQSMSMVGTSGPAATCSSDFGSRDAPSVHLVPAVFTEEFRMRGN